MTNTRTNNEPNELPEAVAPVRARHRELIEAAVSWLADRGRAVDPDHLALVCAGAEHGAEWSGADGVLPTRWTRMGCYHVVRCDIPNWCSTQRCPWPVELPQVMWAWFDFLHGSGRLDPTSDPVAELRKPLACYGWLDQDGQPLPAGAARQVECECLLPYRETTALLDELIRQCERSGEDPLDQLRRMVGRPTRQPPAADRFPWWDPDDEIYREPDDPPWL